MSKYGEPWRYGKTKDLLEQDVLRIRDRDNNRMQVGHETPEGTHNNIGVWAEDRYAQRIVACVNALSGLDPAALKGLLEAADKVLGMSGLDWAHGWDAVEELRSALAALRKEAP